MRIGLIAGLTGVFVSLVGMVEAFSKRGIIGGILSMDQGLLLLLALVTGYLAGRPAAGHGYRSAVGRGLLAGSLLGASLALLILVGEAINLRAVFVNASPALYSRLTFGQGLPWGPLLMLGAGALGGGLGAALHLLPARFRRPLLMGLCCAAAMGVLQDLVRITVASWGPLSVLHRWLYTSEGLTRVGAASVFILIGGGNYLWGARRGAPRLRGRSLLPRSQSAVRLGGLLLLAGVLAALPYVAGLFLSEVLTIVGLFTMMGLGLNIVVGFSGLLDLGYVAFFAIGAYAMGVLTSPELGFFELSFWAALPLSILVGVFAGILLGVPVLRMRGDYLAIVTLGFGEIIRIMALSDSLRPWFGGAQGIAEIPKPVVGGLEFVSPQQLYYVVLAGCLVAGFIAWRLKYARIGRAWMAIREDEDVASAMGINLVFYKLLAFGTGAAFAAMSGAIFASKLGSIYPHSFSLLISVNVLAIVIVGGMGNIPGVLVGAVALVGLPELLREFGDFRLLVYGAALVAMMLLKPEGFWPEAARRRAASSSTAAAADALNGTGAPRSGG